MRGVDRDPEENACISLKFAETDEKNEKVRGGVGFELKKKTCKFSKISQEKKARNVNIRRFAKKSDAELQANAHSGS